MAGWSQTVIIGNVGRDAELKYLPSGVPVASFSVAVTKRWFDKATNEQKDKTVWYRVSAWRNLAETVNTYVRKGMQIMVVGTVEARAYMDQSGQPAASLELTADNVQFLGSRNDGQQGDYGGEYTGGDYAGAAPTNVDDIPF